MVQKDEIEIGKVRLKQNKVYRPSGFWSPSTQQFLTFLKEHQFYSAPMPYGFDEKGREVVSFVEGQVYNYPLVGEIISQQALVSAAKLLRDYHELSANFVKSYPVKEMPWMLPIKEPCEVICHGDFAPYNVALKGKQVVGMFDFDAAHPAPRLWDIAYAVYCWAPFKTNPDDALGQLSEQINRAKLFCDAYGLANECRLQLVDKMVERLQVLLDFMFKQAEAGEQNFIDNIDDGHHHAYINDIKHLQQVKQLISDGLV